MFAPYNDMGGYKDSDPLNPIPNLVLLSNQYGWKAATAAFIQSDPSGNPAWAGLALLPVLNQTECSGVPSWGTCNGTYPQAQWIYTNLMNYISSKGNLIISQGGVAGTSLAQYWYQQMGNTEDAIQKLADLYTQIIETFPGLYGLDFDIEGSAQDDGSYQILIDALRIVRIAYPNLPITFTLPVLPTGLTSVALPIVQAVYNEAISSNLSPIVDIYNLMVMDFGTGPWSGNMGTLANSALSATYNQIKGIYLKLSFSYANLGATPMIGVNDIAPEIFTIDDMKNVLGFSNNNKLGLLAFWDGQRDNIDTTARGETVWKIGSDFNSGTNNPTGAYSEVFNQFMLPPVPCCLEVEGFPSGVTISVGGNSYAFTGSGETVCNNISPGTYQISPAIVKVGARTYALTSSVIIFSARCSNSSPCLISYEEIQMGTLALSISSIPFQGVTLSSFPTILVGSYSYAFTSLGTVISEELPVRSYRVTPAALVAGGYNYTAEPFTVEVIANKNISVSIVYQKGAPVPVTYPISVNVSGGPPNPTVFVFTTTDNSINVPWKAHISCMGISCSGALPSYGGVVSYANGVVTIDVIASYLDITSSNSNSIGVNGVPLTAISSITVVDSSGVTYNTTINM